MIGQAQIVVGAEIQHLTASPDGDMGRLVPQDGPLGLPQGLVANGVEFGDNCGRLLGERHVVAVEDGIQRAGRVSLQRGDIAMQRIGLK